MSIRTPSLPTSDEADRLTPLHTGLWARHNAHIPLHDAAARRQETVPRTAEGRSRGLSPRGPVGLCRGVVRRALQLVDGADHEPNDVLRQYRAANEEPDLRD